jgi:PAS domain S-box-containing protein
MEESRLKDLSKSELIKIFTECQNKLNSDEDILPLNINYKILLDAVSDIIFLVDKNENLIYRNLSWQDFFPSIASKPLGEHYSEYVPVNEKKRADFVFSSIINDGMSFDNELMKTEDEKGNLLYFNTSWSPLKSCEGEILGLVGIMRDITERVLAQKKLKDNSKILESKVKEFIIQSEELKSLRYINDDIIVNSPIGIFMMDPSGIMLSENPALKQIMRHGTETRVGFNLLNYEGFVNSGLNVQFEKCISDKKTIKYSNIPYVPISEFDELIINVTMVPIIDENGSIKRVLVMVEDNTEQSRASKKANRMEKLYSMGLLASGVASELRKPINKMYMDLNFVENNVEKDSRAAEYIVALKEQLHRIRNISEQLLALSGSGSDDTEKELCEINKIFTTHPIDLLLNKIGSDTIEVKIQLADENPTIMATPNQLKQILYDILENAGEAMPDGGILSIVVDTFKSDNKKFVSITISDTGIGMPEENLKRIFDPFFTTKGEDATGLGLMIASTIVENLGGVIAVKSKAGEGTSFKIAMPLLKGKEDE